MNLLRVLLLSICIASGTASVSAQSAWPDKPLRFYVGFPPGGSPDIVARLIGQKLSDRLKQSVIVEQKVGGVGLVANDAIAKAPPDGYTLGLLTGGHPGTAAVMKKLPYDPVNDFGMVTMVVDYPMVIAVVPDSPIKSLPDLIARAKAQPGKLSYSTTGPGSLHHLLGEWMNAEAGTSMLNVPYKGTSEPLTDLLSGRIDVMIQTATFLFPQIRSGKLRAIALSSNGRYPLMPEVATVAETLPGIAFSSWLGLVVAPKTPRPIIDRLNTEMRAILAEDDTRQRFAGLGGVPAPSTPEAMREQIEREIQRWTRIVESRGLERQ